MHYHNALEKSVWIGAPALPFCEGGGAKKITIFFFNFEDFVIHIVCIDLGLFSDDKYSVVTMLYNYLQINNQITLFLKKNVFKHYRWI